MRLRGGSSSRVWGVCRALEVLGRVHGGTAAEKSSDEQCAAAATRASSRSSVRTLDSRSGGSGARAERMGGSREVETRRRASSRSPAHGGAEDSAKLASLPTMAAMENERVGGASGGEARACAGEARAGVVVANHAGDGERRGGGALLLRTRRERAGAAERVRERNGTRRVPFRV